MVPTIILDQLNQSEFRADSSNSNITAEKQFLLCLWYLSNTESFRQLSDRFNVSLSSSHRLLLRTLSFLFDIGPDYIKWPSAEEKVINSIQFEKQQGFKGIIGCIDGSHFKILRPEKDEEVYVNRKGYHSVIMQGIVDHRKLFIDVYCGESGSLHDARVLRRSTIFRNAENPNFFGNYYLIGDSAYPYLEWLVVPFKDNGLLTEEHKQFNFKLSSTRMAVEHAFGLLKRRFRRLGHFENLNIDIIVKCIMSSCILHNICILENDVEISDVEDDFDEANDDESVLPVHRATANSPSTSYGISNRQEEIYEQVMKK